MDTYEELMDSYKEIERASVALESLIIVHENVKIFGTTGKVDDIIQPAFEVLGVPSYEGLTSGLVEGFKKFGNMILEWLNKIWSFFGDFFRKNSPASINATIAAALGCSVDDIKNHTKEFDAAQNEKLAVGYQKEQLLSAVSNIEVIVANIEKTVDSKKELDVETSVNTPLDKKENETVAGLGYKAHTDYIAVPTAITNLEKRIKAVCTKVDTSMKELARELKAASTASEETTITTKQNKGKALLAGVVGLSKRLKEITSAEIKTRNGLLKALRTVSKRPKEKEVKE